MSSLNPTEKRDFEQLFSMNSGSVLDFTDQSFSDFFIDTIRLNIDDEKYRAGGTSKAKRLRTFWRLEPDAVVGPLLAAMIGYSESAERADPPNPALLSRCKASATRLSGGSAAGLGLLKDEVGSLDYAYLEQQINRMEVAIRSDPPLAIGTAKELVETVCKTILKERARTFAKDIELGPLVKLVLEELQVEGLFEPVSVRGGDKVRRILGSLASVTQGIAELRNQYGTGHGKVGTTPPVDPILAVLAVGAAATFCHFVLQFHRSHPPGGTGLNHWDPSKGGGKPYIPPFWNNASGPVQPTLG
jgi:hypothetical protein